MDWKAEGYTVGHDSLKEASFVGSEPGQISREVAEAIQVDHWNGMKDVEISEQRGVPLSQVQEIICLFYPLLPDERGYDWTGCAEVVHVRRMMGGVPTLKNIRMAASQVAELHKGGYSPARMALSYSLPLEQVKRVVEFAFPGTHFTRTGVDWSGCGAVVRSDRFMQPWIVKGTHIDPDAVLEQSENKPLAELASILHVSKEDIQALLDFAISQVGGIHGHSAGRTTTS
jgi:uncharacterized protein (DUF433 family)